jgi:hypothetical protein
MTYRQLYLLEVRRLRILQACDWDRDQARAVEQMLRNRGCW